MWTAQARANASAIAHTPRQVKCSWPGCTVTVTTRKHGGNNYCPAHRALRKRENNQVQSEAKRQRKQRLAPCERDQGGIEWWTVLIDPDGDFTGKRFSACEMAAMRAHGSLRHGARIEKPTGEVIEV